MLRKLLMTMVATGGLFAAAAPARAADLGVRPYAPPAPAYATPAPVFTWTGFYIGGNAGGKWGDYGVEGFLGNVPLVNFRTPNDSGFLGGGQVGFNWQFSQFVFGLEGDFDGTTLKSSVTSAFVPGFGVITGFAEAKTRWEASIRARGGIALDRLLVYATGGAAFAEVNASGTVHGFSADQTETLTGWTVGGGLEYALTNAISLGVEYRYSDFGHETFNLGIDPVFLVPLSAEIDHREHQVTGRLNFRFGSLFGPY